MKNKIKKVIEDIAEDSVLYAILLYLAIAIYTRLNS